MLGWKWGGQVNVDFKTQSSKFFCGAGRPYVPYRDSKLTHLLRESLGGNTKSNLIVSTFSNPSIIHFILAHRFHISRFYTVV